ncbi:hypothetical protein AGDE_16215 [Angomonas deanei]|uniref:Uncharacterized protein n=1 Tax=Angomonas deanei TaxID=59799 RepID=A0A7G2C1J4_9TRYP|nr:hypothetical protein AGDE_16215 [Angomonas deanei]CAD2213590.1 hypothetical protein, conserved [Angomonas deanei]|eukprot:EPY17495.1 hypothetical protein AGDE_16215 [Angomonas deanei]
MGCSATKETQTQPPDQKAKSTSKKPSVPLYPVSYDLEHFATLVNTAKPATVYSEERFGKLKREPKKEAKREETNPTSRLLDLSVPLVNTAKPSTVYTEERFGRKPVALDSPVSTSPLRRHSSFRRQPSDPRSLAASLSFANDDVPLKQQIEMGMSYFLGISDYKFPETAAPSRPSSRPASRRNSRLPSVTWAPALRLDEDKELQVWEKSYIGVLDSAAEPADSEIDYLEIIRLDYPNLLLNEPANTPATQSRTPIIPENDGNDERAKVNKNTTRSTPKVEPLVPSILQQAQEEVAGRGQRTPGVTTNDGQYYTRSQRQTVVTLISPTTGIAQRVQPAQKRLSQDNTEVMVAPPPEISTVSSSTVASEALTPSTQAESEALTSTTQGRFCDAFINISTLMQELVAYCKPLIGEQFNPKVDVQNHLEYLTGLKQAMHHSSFLRDAAAGVQHYDKVVMESGVKPGKDLKVFHAMVTTLMLRIRPALKEAEKVDEMIVESVKAALNASYVRGQKAQVLLKIKEVIFNEAQVNGSMAYKRAVESPLLGIVREHREIFNHSVGNLTESTILIEFLLQLRYLISCLHVIYRYIQTVLLYFTEREKSSVLKSEKSWHTFPEPTDVRNLTLRRFDNDRAFVLLEKLTNYGGDSFSHTDALKSIGYWPLGIDDVYKPYEKSRGDIRKSLTTVAHEELRNKIVAMFPDATELPQANTASVVDYMILQFSREDPFRCDPAVKKAIRHRKENAAKMKVMNATKNSQEEQFTRPIDRKKLRLPTHLYKKPKDIYYSKEDRKKPSTEERRARRRLYFDRPYIQEYFFYRQENGAPSAIYNPLTVARRVESPVWSEED